MTISIEHLLEQSQMSLLKASVELVNKDQEIAALKDDARLKDAQIAILQCKLQRTVVPFHKRERETA